MSNPEARLKKLQHPVVPARDWLEARRKLLVEEKALTKHGDRVSAARRRLPWVRIDKPYEFQGPRGPVTLADLFEGRDQLIVYHFMFDPAWDEGCQGCTPFMQESAPALLQHLHEKHTTLVMISRAPYTKLADYQAEKGLCAPWYSSFGSDFNYDFHVTLDEKVAPSQHNFRDRAELEQRSDSEPYYLEGEQHGLSTFVRNDGAIFHTYSTYARGIDHLWNSHNFLDLTPLGRQEDWEDSPPG
jgi:predicted dithiol-disulfide oxidoreductase (DUF899 family)